ncbi:hypothetical protein TNCV_4377341 [Trichonephila clavipes]|nr:hypothetical protein TNCV_4377341 [Trichonephila clavipes]
MTLSASSIAEVSSEVGTMALIMPQEERKSSFNHQRFIMLAEKEIAFTVWKLTPIKRNFIFGNFPFCNSLNNFRAANLEPVHSSPSPNHKAAFQPFQDGLFHHFDFVSKCLRATPSLHLPTTNQVVPSPQRIAIPLGTLNDYDMGWRLALRAICPATAILWILIAYLAIVPKKGMGLWKAILPPMLCAASSLANTRVDFWIFRSQARTDSLQHNYLASHSTQTKHSPSYLNTRKKLYSWYSKPHPMRRFITEGGYNFRNPQNSPMFRAFKTRDCLSPLTVLLEGQSPPL